MAQRRAKQGGEVGANGDDYKGGQFIATTDKPKAKKTRGTGRVEFEPYKWDVPPEGCFPIFAALGTQAAWIDRYDPSKGVELYAPGIAYYGPTFRGHAIQDLCDAWNRGERWAVSN